MPTGWGGPVARACATAVLMAVSSAAAAQAAGDPPPNPPAATQQTQQTPQQTPQTPAAPSAPAVGTAGFDVNQLFAASCGWCHGKGGREAGKGPQLMGTTLTDSEIVSRIKLGKVGQMPGFASSFNDEQLRAIVRYIRELKPATP